MSGIPPTCKPFHVFIPLKLSSEETESYVLGRRLVYHPTHARAGSWIVGMIFGYILFHVGGKKVAIRKVCP